MKKYLSLKITALLAVCTIVISVISSWFFYLDSYTSEMQRSMNSAQQLLETVIETASIAAYLDQHEMAREVVSGLAKNDIVAKVSLRTSDGQTIVAGNANKQITGQQANTKKVSRILFSPFSEVQIGELILTPDIQIIENRAQNAGMANAIILASQTALTTLLALLLFYTYLTRPIKKIASRLHKITPGDDERLEYPKGHRHDEIGSLIADTNRLLDSAQQVIADERDLREKVESLEIQYHQLFSRSNAAIFIANRKGKLVTHNLSFENIFSRTGFSLGKSEDEQPIFKMFASQDDVAKLIQKAWIEDRSVSTDLELLVSDTEEPEWVHCIFSITTDEKYREPLVEGVLFDITQRKASERLSQYQAEHDQLTGLLNRHGAERRLERSVRGERRSDRNLTIFLLDLDGFKNINDNYGHDAGDKVLTEVADRLATVTREADQIVRWGGDEFLIIISSEIGLEAIRGLAQKVVDIISKPIDLGNGVSASVGVSIGIASLGEQIHNLQELIKRSDRAMYEVKYQGKNNFCIYDSDRGSFEVNKRLNL